MKEYYTYDELYGTLLHKNEDDTERVYFIIECEYYKFNWWMFAHGWNKQSQKVCVRNGNKGFEIALERNKNNPTQ